MGRDDTCAAGFRPWNPTDSRFPAAVVIVAVSVVGSFSGSAHSYHSSIIRLGPLPAVDYFSRCLETVFYSAKLLIRAFSSVTSCWRSASGGFWVDGVCTDLAAPPRCFSAAKKHSCSTAALSASFRVLGQA